MATHTHPAVGARARDVNTALQDALLRRAALSTRYENATERALRGKLAEATRHILTLVRDSHLLSGERLGFGLVDGGRQVRLQSLLRSIALILGHYVADSVLQVRDDLKAKATLDLKELPHVVNATLQAQSPKVKLQEAEGEDRDWELYESDECLWRTIGGHPVCLTKGHGRHEQGMHLALDTVEAQIASRRREHFYVFPPSGEPFSRVGGMDAVDFSDDDLAKMRGAVLTHNHPKPLGLSLKDVDLLLQTGAKEIRAVTKPYIYSLAALRPVDAGEAERLGEEFSRLASDVQRQVQVNLIVGKYSTPREASSAWWHEVSEAIAQRHPDLFSYKRIDREVRQEAAADIDPEDRDWELPLFRSVPVAQVTELLGTPLGGAFFQQSFADLAAGLLASVRNVLLWGLTTGQGVQPVARKLQGVMGNSRWQAERIVRSEFVRAANQAALTTFAQNEEVLDGVQWVATLDDRTCLQCGVLDGRTWENLEAAPIPVTDTHPNCFIPSTKVEGQFLLGTRMLYAGPVVEIQTRNGHRLTVTPNHPVLTAWGFTAAHRLREGDHLLSRWPRVSRDQQQHMPVPIEQVFDAIRLRGFGQPAIAAVEDFHGDAVGGQGEVDVVAVNRVLLDHAVAAFSQAPGDGALVGAHVEEPGHAGLGSANLLVTRLPTAPARLPRLPQLPLDAPGARAQSGPFEALSVGAAANVHAALAEASEQYGTGDARVFGELLEGGAGLIALDEIVEIRHGHYAGHVYDLQSLSGYILAEDIVVSNCRCILVPVVKDADSLGLPPASRASFNGQVPATLDYDTWFSQQDPAFQREVLGPRRFDLYQSDRASLGDFATASGVRRVRDVLADFEETFLEAGEATADCHWVTIRGNAVCISGGHTHERTATAEQKGELQQEATADGCTWRTIPGRGPICIKPGHGEHVRGEHARVARSEVDLRGHAVEHLQVFTPKGLLVLDKIGTESEVTIPPEDMARLAGSIIVHNHPAGRSFSPDDIRLLLDTGAVSIRAVGHDRVFQMDNLQPTRRDAWDEIASAVREADTTIHRDYTAKLNARTMTLDEANATHHDAVWREVTTRFPGLLRYSVRPFKPGPKMLAAGRAVGVDAAAGAIVLDHDLAAPIYTLGPDGQVVVRPMMLAEAWDESEHPRDDRGRFADKGDAGTPPSADFATTQALTGHLPAAARFLTDQGWQYVSASPTAEGARQAMVYRDRETGDTLTVFASGRWRHTFADGRTKDGRRLLGLKLHVFTQAFRGPFIGAPSAQLEAAEEACHWITYQGRRICITPRHAHDVEPVRFATSLGIERKAMPQIRAKDMAEFLSYVSDHGVRITRETVSAASLKPAQAHYNPQQVAQMQPENMGKPLVVSREGYILDGTHRWVRFTQSDPEAPVAVLRIDRPATEAIALMKRFPKAEVQDIGDIGAPRGRRLAPAMAEAAEKEYRGLTMEEAAADDCHWITYQGRRICIGGDRHGRHGDTEPRIFMRPDDLEKVSGWGGEEKWKDKQKGDILRGPPLAKADLPATLYHTTTAAPAIEKAGMLLGQSDGGGMGGGAGRPGVSFTTSRADAELMLKELDREIELAQSPPDMSGATTRRLLERYAREDEQAVGLPSGSFQRAVDYAMGNYDANVFPVTHVFDMDKYGGYSRDVLRPTAELERGLRSLGHDAHSAYMQARESDATAAFGADYRVFKSEDRYAPAKNPLIFGDADAFRKLDRKNLGILEVPSAAIPDGALIRPGTDHFLHEIRVHADVPLKPKEPA